MLAGLVLAVALFADGGRVKLPPPPPLTPATRALVAPIGEAIATVRARHAAMPPPKDDAERLVRMGELDQAPRWALTRIDFSSVTPAERQAGMLAVWAEITPIDEANEAELLRMVPPEGWFTRSRYGAAAAEAAFHIVQHSHLDLWRRFVPVFEPLVATGEVEGDAYAKMFDRLALHEGRPQRYGTQYRCEGGRWTLDRVEDASRLEANRKAMGMSTHAHNLARFAAMPPC